MTTKSNVNILSGNIGFTMNTDRNLAKSMKTPSNKKNAENEVISREDKKMLLQLEINMELVSLCLQRKLESKRKKQEELRLANSDLLKEIHEADNVFLLYDKNNRKFLE